MATPALTPTLSREREREQDRGSLLNPWPAVPSAAQASL
ncbi:hypothetical protein CBM2589_B10177 [Cupriavidus taiwanensis]|uniref:Uncharacterized protein n=1 Tax=Cupriavidus taiwanensis TaxID=164546 RepID=A0A375B894_9BURK|nr:hypothetical protein CBM2589_B10177 [Cupriavidus taiwanensis]